MSDQAPDASRIHFASVLCILSKQILAVIGCEVEAETGDEENGCPFEDCRGPGGIAGC